MSEVYEHVVALNSHLYEVVAVLEQFGNFHKATGGHNRAHHSRGLFNRLNALSEPVAVERNARYRIFPYLEQNAFEHGASVVRAYRERNLVYEVLKILFGNGERLRFAELFYLRIFERVHALEHALAVGILYFQAVGFVKT